MSHTTNIPQLLATGTREDLIAYCQWNDRNGLWSDDDRASEDYEPATLEYLRSVIAAWDRECRVVQTTNCNDEPVWAYAVNGNAVYAPTFSECGQFAVDPMAAYGLTPDDVEYLATINSQFGYNDQL
jgi:hypothetical protein